MAGKLNGYSGRSGVIKRTDVADERKNHGSGLMVLNSEVFLVVDREGHCSFLNPAIRKVLQLNEHSISEIPHNLLVKNEPVLLSVRQSGGAKLVLQTRFSEASLAGRLVYVARLDDTVVLSQKASLPETDPLQAEFHKTVLAVMNTYQDVDRGLEALLLQLVTHFRCPHGFLYLLDESDPQVMKQRISVGPIFERRSVIERPVRPGAGLVGVVWHSGEALFVNDYRSWQGRAQDVEEIAASLQAMAAVPVSMAGKTIGVLGLAYDSDRQFSQGDIDVIERFSRLVSMLILNARQINQTQVEMAAHEAYEIRLRMQSRLLAGASEALKTLIVSQDIDRAISEALAYLGEAAMVDHIYIFENTARPDTGELCVGLRIEWQRSTGSICISDAQETGIPYDPDMQEWRTALESGNTVSCSCRDAAHNGRTVIDFCQGQSMLLLPILVGEKFWGIMGFADDKAGREWQEEEYSILAAAAAGLGTVIDRRQVEDVLLATEERFQAFMDNSPLLVYMRDDEGRYIFINEQLRNIYKLPKDSFVGRRPDELFPAEAARQIMDGETEVLRDGQTQDKEYRHALPDESIRYWRELKFPIDGPAGSRYVGGIIQDMTERIMAQEELKRWAAELERRNRELALLSQMNKFLQACVRPEAAYSVLVEYARQLFPDESGILLMHTENGERLYPAAWWGDEFDSEFSIRIEDCPVFQREMDRQANGSDFASAVEKCDTFPWSGAATRLCLPILAQEQAFEQAQVVGVMCMWGNEHGDYIYENQRQLAMTLSEQIGLTLSNLNLSTRLRQQAIRDPLTGLFNRRYLYETLERELKRSERDGQQTSVLMIDLDHFKRINDNYGHATGDDALRHIGAILRQSVRGSDIASRYGGEEFVLALLSAGLEDAVHRAHQILSLVRKLSLTVDRDHIIHITVSIGVATFPQHGMTTDSLLSAADAAMYRAKQKGRDCVVIAENVPGGEG